jgi:hypothetical protein
VTYSTVLTVDLKLPFNKGPVDSIDKKVNQ